MASIDQDSGKTATRAWLRHETRVGSQGARGLVLLGLVGTLLAIAQAFCAAFVLAGALHRSGGGVSLALAGFVAMALARAGVAFASDRAAFEAGAAARRRLRSDALARLLHAGPAMLRERHSGDLTAIVVDRIEALDGLFSRWVPASVLAVGGPTVVGVAALVADPVAGAILIGCGLLVPVAMALAGIGAAAASRSQFLALARLQARFLDRVRGIATIVLYGQADAEARSLAAAADELRVRTMRVLRVAFLSSAALDLAVAAARPGSYYSL